MSDEQRTQRSEGLLETPAASMWDDLSPASEVSVEEMQHAPQREAYVDPAVAQAQAEDEWPSWVGVRWRDVPEESRAEAWTWLRSWVDWLVRVHHVSQDRIPRCWYRHSDVVEELWAAANAEAQAWESTGPTMTPMTTWHFHLQMMLDRRLGRAHGHSGGHAAGGRHRRRTLGVVADVRGGRGRAGLLVHTGDGGTLGSLGRAHGAGPKARRHG